MLESNLLNAMKLSNKAGQIVSESDWSYFRLGGQGDILEEETFELRPEGLSGAKHA